MRIKYVCEIESKKLSWLDFGRPHRSFVCEIASLHRKEVLCMYTCGECEYKGKCMYGLPCRSKVCGCGRKAPAPQLCLRARVRTQQWLRVCEYAQIRTVALFTRLRVPHRSSGCESARCPVRTAALSARLRVRTTAVAVSLRFF